MSPISPLVGVSARRPEPTPQWHSAAPPAAHRSHVRDAVEIADVAPVHTNPVSPERLAEIRAQIASGTYVTDHKLDVVVARLHAALTTTRPAPAEAGAA